MHKILSTLLLACASLAAPAAASTELRLYALDCGRIEFDDLGAFSDTGEYDGHADTLMASCFLIRHERGTLLWDAGLGDRLAALADGSRARILQSTLVQKVPVTLRSQLQSLGLDFDRIDYFAFSHGHLDHLGNANALTRAKWIVNRREQAWIGQTPAPPRTDTRLIEGAGRAGTIMIERDHDVFGDGTVRILSAPGHTPGHQVLLVKLPRAGAVLLSGDLYHTHDNRAGRRLPAFNVDRADTLASMDRIEKIVANHKARVVIQHSIGDFRALPKVPGYLD